MLFRSTHPWYSKGKFHDQSWKLPSWIIIWIRNIFLKYKKKFKCSKKFLIDRSESNFHHCQIINKKQVESFLIKNGFKIYRIGEYSFVKQIFMFWNAKYIIGAHGAAFANLIFCKPNTKIIEFKPFNHPGRNYEKISKINKLNYQKIISKKIKLIKEPNKIKRHYKLIQYASSRGFEKDLIVDVLKEMVDADKLENLFTVAEKGTLWMDFLNYKNDYIFEDKNVSVHDDLKKTIKKITEDEYSDSMVFDFTKKTMISVEKNNIFTINAFQKRQEKFIKEIQSVLDLNDYSNEYIIDKTKTSTDIQSVKVGKDMGAKRVLDWLASRGVSAETYY